MYLDIRNTNSKKHINDIDIKYIKYILNYNLGVYYPIVGTIFNKILSTKINTFFNLNTIFLNNTYINEIIQYIKLYNYIILEINKNHVVLVYGYEIRYFLKDSPKIHLLIMDPYNGEDKLKESIDFNNYDLFNIIIVT